MNIPADGWYRLDVPVRFRDVDAMGHAHHTLPLIYLEEARAAFWRELKGSPLVADIDYVMAEITLRFHARVLYPSTVSVLLAVSNVGTKSFTTTFEIRDAAGTLLSSGSAVQVAYDYAAGSAKEIEAADRKRLEAWHAARSAPAGQAGSIAAGPAPA
jgi:acyl-CoA thioester hydrolase